MILGHNLTFERYHKINDIYKYVDYIYQEYADLVEVETIGKSHEGVPLRVIRIKPDQNATNIKTIWIDGGIHAREWIAVSSVLYLINELVYNRDSLETHMKNTEFHILPILNPDGSVLIFLYLWQLTIHKIKLNDLYLDTSIHTKKNACGAKIETNKRRIHA